MSRFVTLPVTKMTIDLDLIGWIVPAGTDKIGYYHVFWKVPMQAFPTIGAVERDLLLEQLGAEALKEPPVIAANDSK